MKRLSEHSQHFLRSPRLAHELIGHSSIKKRDTVLDIGAGSGVITSALALRCKQVVAIENDPRMIATLRKNMQHFSNVRVEQADIMTVSLPDYPYKVFANIPFKLSSAIVRRLTAAIHPPEATYLIVQNEFARKLLPEHRGFTSILGAQIGAAFAVRVRRTLHPADFVPSPRVTCALLEIIPRTEPLIPSENVATYTQFIEQSFTTPAFFKTLPFQECCISTDVKPSQLTIPEWARLFKEMLIA